MAIIYAFAMFTVNIVSIEFKVNHQSDDPEH